MLHQTSENQVSSQSVDENGDVCKFPFVAKFYLRKYDFLEKTCEMFSLKAREVLRKNVGLAEFGNTACT